MNFIFECSTRYLTRPFFDDFRRFPITFRRIPKITDDFREMTDHVSIIQQTYLRDYVTRAMVIILVAMATSISSHVKNINSIFTACDENMIFSKRKSPGISLVFI